MSRLRSETFSRAKLSLETHRRSEKHLSPTISAIHKNKTSSLACMQPCSGKMIRARTLNFEPLEG